MTSVKQQIERSRKATSPWQMPPAAWRAVAVRVWNQSWVDNIGLVAAGVAFYGFLALVPLLGIVVLTYGLVTEPSTVVQHVLTLIRILPADIAKLIGQVLMNAVLASQNTRSVGYLIAGAVALYAGGNGAAAIMTALNIAYEEKEKRSLLHFYAIALLMTGVGLVLALAALAMTAAAQSAEALLPRAPETVLLLGRLGFYLVMVIVGAAVAATLYRYGPSREDARWHWLTPGSLFTSSGWLLLTLGFGFYVTKLTDYNATYGSLAAIVMLLTWMYLSAYVFLFGAELNAELEHQTAKDSTTGKPLPLGQRGAWAADHVAGLREDGTETAGPSLGEAGPPPPTEEIAKPD